MSSRSKGSLVKAAGVLVGLMALAALLAAVGVEPTREIVLVAEDMTFYLEGDPRTPNPTIEVKAGERVRVRLRNQERGMAHDFAVPALDTALDPLRWNESADVVLDVPSGPGVYEYVCRPHRLMMRGIIRVVP